MDLAAADSRPSNVPHSSIASGGCITPARAGEPHETGSAPLWSMVAGGDQGGSFPAKPSTADHQLLDHGGSGPGSSTGTDGNGSGEDSGSSERDETCHGRHVRSDAARLGAGDVRGAQRGGRPALRKRTLQLAHTGLRPQHMSRVGAALEEAPRLRRIVLEGGPRAAQLKATRSQHKASTRQQRAALDCTPPPRAFVYACHAAICTMHTQGALATSPAGSPERAGNLLTDASVAELVGLMAASSAAPHLRDLDLSSNAALTWRCCQPVAQLLGGCPAAAPTPEPGRQGAGVEGAAPGDAGGGGGSNSGVPAGAVRLRRLRLEGVQIGDKGAAILAAALASSQHLQVGGRGGLRPVALARGGWAHAAL